MTENVNNKIRSIIIEALEVRDCTRKELLEKIKQGLPESKSMDPGVISGVFKDMKEYGEINNVSRGVYRRGDGNQNRGIQSEVKRLVNRFRNGLDRKCTVNLLHIDECDKDYIVKIQSIVNKFDADIKAAYSDYDNKLKFDMDKDYPVPNEKDTSDSGKGISKDLEKK